MIAHNGDNYTNKLYNMIYLCDNTCVVCVQIIFNYLRYDWYILITANETKYK